MRKNEIPLDNQQQWTMSANYTSLFPVVFNQSNLIQLLKTFTNRVQHCFLIRIIVQQGGEAHSYQCDLSSREQVYQIAKRIKDDIGVITMLVNNAGIVSGSRLLDTSDGKGRVMGDFEYDFSSYIRLLRNTVLKCVSAWVSLFLNLLRRNSPLAL